MKYENLTKYHSHRELKINVYKFEQTLRKGQWLLVCYNVTCKNMYKETSIHVYEESPS